MEQDMKLDDPPVSSKSSGIATQLLEHMLKNESSTSDDVKLERRDTFDTEENIAEVKETGTRKRREIYKCPHTDRKHYAKNMCHNCYHRKGKSKMAYACGHTTKSHYSSGMCQNCYLAKYYIKRKNKMEEKAKDKEEEEAAKKEETIEETPSTDTKKSLIGTKRQRESSDDEFSMSSKKQRVEE
jgi:hypothetical protein